MSCLGGSPEAPRGWVRLTVDGRIEHHAGRVCNRTHPLTNRRFCSPCPAYRGIRTDSSTATGLYPDGTPYGLSAHEYDEYGAALVAMLEDDDPAPFAAWESRLTGIGDRTLREIGDPDALDRRAAYMRDYRKRRPGHDRSAGRVARWRARKRNVNTLSTPSAGTGANGRLGTQARAHTRGVVTLHDR